ncbi:hypothetical protein BDM02DRAFT_3262860 [Thelephora ganbajun]|uniref:Uncharacterized protein n=1 Tax=Thelephora ganbajun TaxID=370292 RepID=A0ACB6Z876_THEGA|nr:hypothetical protein BDM02DRAFT_3262860 [Thelephora ganbajun]
MWRRAPPPVCLLPSGLPFALEVLTPPPHPLDTMRFSTVLVILSAAFATTSATRFEARQNSFADCASTCLNTAIDHSSCYFDDDNCLCHEKAFIKESVTCFQKSCSGNDLTQSIAAIVALCRAEGVTYTTSAFGPTSTHSSSTASSPGPSSANRNAGASNDPNVLFALSALGLIGYAL